MKNLINFFVLILIFSSISYSQIELFKDFSTKFFSDSVFQRARIRFPLKMWNNHLKQKNFDIQYLSQKEWYYSEVDSLKVDSLNSESIKMTYIDPWKAQHMPLRVICHKSGIRIDYYFLPFKGKWFLIWISYLLD